jgi:hypothetical protein
MCDEFVETPCFDSLTGEFIAGCPFWSGSGHCILVTRGMRPDDCPMDEKFHWWGYQSRKDSPVFSDEQVQAIRELLQPRDKEGAE